MPCPTQADDWPEAERQRYCQLLAACDYETLVSARYTPDCMQRRNRYLVDHAALLIAAYDGKPLGTYPQDEAPWDHEPGATGYRDPEGYAFDSQYFR